MTLHPPTTTNMVHLTICPLEEEVYLAMGFLLQAAGLLFDLTDSEAMIVTGLPGKDQAVDLRFV